MPKKYSELFTTLYDEAEPKENIGRGCHYSVLRAKDNTSQEQNTYFDFAIIWDEDHDERIINVLEDLYREKKLINFIIVGERKGCFTAILHSSQSQNNPCVLPETLNVDGDLWVANILTLQAITGCTLIQTGEKESKQYVQSIIDKWVLGNVIVEQSLSEQEMEKQEAVEKQDIDELAREFDKKATIDIYKSKIVRARTNKESRQVSMYGVPTVEKAKSLEQKWQKKVTSKFFKIGVPLQEERSSQKIYMQIDKYLDTSEKGKEKPSLKIDGVPRRSLIIALSKILTKYEKMPGLVFRLGDTTIEFKETNKTARQRQRGNFKMVIPGIYDIAYGAGCLKRINYLYMPSWDNSQNYPVRMEALLKSIHDRLQRLDPFTHSLFNKYGNFRIRGERGATMVNKTVQENVHFLNGLIFLVTIVEVLVRLYRADDGDIFNYKDQNGVASDLFPVAIAQARSILLLITQKISFNDFIGETSSEKHNKEQYQADYGVVTGKNTIDNISLMYNKLVTINELYIPDISHRPVWSTFSNDYKKSNEAGTIIEGRSRMYFDLKEVYGSGSESDDESSNYSDSDDSELGNVIPYDL